MKDGMTITVPAGTAPEGPVWVQITHEDGTTSVEEVIVTKWDGREITLEGR